MSVATTAVEPRPMATVMPMAAVVQMLAAVVRPSIDSSFSCFRIEPAPRKPIPAMRPWIDAGHGLLVVVGLDAAR